MALDDAHQAGTDAALLDMVQRPQAPRPQAPAFSMWGLMKAPAKGTAAGANQAVGSTADMLGAFGDVLGSVGDAGSQGMFGGLTDQERQQSNAARDKLLKDGPNYNTEAGRLFRDAAKDYMPDPVTAHAAENAVANFFRVGSKAVTAAVALGNVPGAIVAGAEEGFTQSDELGQQGVDLATRTKVGAVTAVTNAVGFALPVAGQTWKATVGLAVAGGPASFVAQNLATREILKNANYSHLADQYDPLDPLGLALSTLLPLGFGALAMRGGKAPKARVDDDAVDAARVSLLRESVDAARPVPAEDLAGAAAHNNSVARAIDQMAAGERVDVTDVAPPRAAEVVSEAMGERLRPLVKAYEEEMGARQAVAKARVLDEPIEPVGPIEKQDVVLTKRKGVDAVDVEATTLTLPPIAEGYVRLFRGESPTTKFADVFDVGQLKTERAQHLPGARYTPDLKYADYYRSSYGRDATVHYIDVPHDVAAAGRVSDVEVKVDLDSVNAKRAEQAQVRPKPEAAAQATTSTFKTESPELDRAVQDLEARMPDTMVQLDGMDAPVPLRDLMIRVMDEAKAEAAESPLIEAAANCFLRMGG